MMTGLLLFSGALFFVGALLLITQFFSLFTNAPFVPSSATRVEEMIALAALRPGMRVADLGSGDGRIVIAAAEAGAFAEGWEANPLLVWWSRLIIRRRGLSGRARIHRGSYHGKDFHGYDRIFLYVLAKEMARLEQWLPAAIDRKTQIIVHAFPFPTWTPREKKGTLFCYELPV
jgi:cyclopropane fatty-acyl-phospholipid synthase-like methyltransferase